MNSTLFVACRTEQLVPNVCPVISCLAFLSNQDFPESKLFANVLTSMSHGNTVTLTQQAGWPWPAYPSRLTLRII
jgi:hypothetical protein